MRHTTLPKMRRARSLHRRMAWTSLITILAMLLSFFPQIVGLPIPTASAHNLQTRDVYAYFDQNTQDMLDSRIDGPGWTPPTPLLQVGDEIGLVMKGVPRDGTSTGVGGYLDFYIPNGVTVLDAAYLQPGDSVADGITGYDKIPMKGQSPIAIGAGPIGAKVKTDLIGLTLGPNINGVTEKAVADGTGLMRGTIAGVYGDTGIFYSTAPDTAWNTWAVTGGYDQNPLTNDNTITNNSGDVIVPLNKWDAEQLLAYGAKAPIVAIVDTPDQRGNSPWGLGSGVAGPQSGYAWDFDWDYWRTSGKTAADMRAASDQMGPWQRIQYPGSGISKDQAGLISTVLGFASVDGSNVGYPLSPSNPLPATVSQTDPTSPKVIRFSVGQTTQYVPEYVWVKLRIDDLNSGFIQPDGCPYWHTGAFGGDAGGDDKGQDHLWRYYEPTTVSVNGCVAVGKPADRPVAKVGDIFSYKIKFYNAGTVDLTNVVVKDQLPSGVSFISAVPAQNSGPNPLVWNVGTLLRGQKFEATVTVKATGTGPQENVVTVTSTEFAPVTATEITSVGAIPILSQSKSVSPTTVAPGGTVQYTIRIDNIGSGPSGSPLVIDEYLPAGFTYVSKDSVILNGADVTATTTVNTSSPYSANQPRFTVPGAVNAGQSLVLKFTAQVSSTATAGAYCNYFSTAAGSAPRQTAGFQACVDVGAGTIGDTVFRDWNGNGVQDPEDEGIQGVTVNLYAGTCPPSGSPIQTTTTNADGQYLFAGLNTPANYCVDVTPPAGYTVTADPEGALDGQASVSLAQNETNLTIDFGYQPGGAGSIGDTVFEDVGNDGQFDVGTDTGIDGVTVWLYEDSDGDGVIDPGQDAQIGTTTTSGGGNYSFTNLDPTRYYIVLVDDGPGSAVDTYFTNPYVSSTGNPQTVSPADFTAQGNAVTDADFGYFGQTPGSIGDQVFADNNGNGVYDTGDTPLAGITVTLYRDGELFMTTTSGPDGTYLFDNLGPGNYRVVVDTTDPDVPGGLFATVTQYDVALAVAQNDLTADFPFVNGLTKTVDKAYATTGETLTFTLKPYYPGADLLENVRVIDPLPTGTTYAAGSANAGGTFGAYTPLPADPGSDPEGGPSGTVQLDTTVTPSANFATVGGAAFSVTLNVKQNSGSTVNNVSPVDFDVSNGTAACTGPTPATANVPSGGTGADFVWSCTATSSGELIFSAAAENDTQTYQWPVASSASVLAAPHGGPNVVTWNLGSNTPGVPGETIDAGVPAGIYGFRGANTNTFRRFNITSGAWVARANALAAIAAGGALTSNGVDTIYALRGNKTQAFYAYDAGANSWTARANTGVNVDLGGALVFLNVGGADYVYALMGNGTGFRRYNVSANSWTAMANTPATVKAGGALTTDGTYIYALRGGKQKTFWRCNATTSGSAGSCDTSWTALANVPAVVGWGGALTRVGGYIYAFQGGGKKGFYRYNIATNQWATLAATRGNVADGGALTTDGTYIYAFQGETTAFWRYDIAANKWTALAPYAAATGQGGALTYLPAANLQGRFSSMSAGPTLVSSGHTVQVRMDLESTTAVNNVVPSALTVTPTGGASASCSGPTPASQNIPAGGSVAFIWICTVTPGANPGSLTFSASATGDGPVSFPSATSNSVLVSPVLSFQATVDAGAPPVIENTGILAETSSAFGSLLSNTTETATAGSIGDRVWADLDAQGDQDAGEPGLAGVRVYIDSNDNGVWDTGEPYDITDANGFYRIFGLAAGTYTVRTDPATYPAGYLPTTPTSLSVSLGTGQQYDDADFGLTPPSTGKIGDTIWLDANNNGTLDPGEMGLPNITVRLYLDKDNSGTVSAGDVLVLTDTTDANGNYLFEGLPAGNYLVDVDESSTVVSPYDGNSYTLAAAMQPVFNDSPMSVSLGTGQAYLTADFGYNWTGSIGDYVWYDTNYNGVQDESPATPIAGAYVMLYFDANGNGIIDEKNGDYRIGGMLTDVNGAYLFDNLPPGNYLVDVYEDSITTDGVRDIVPTTSDVVAVTLGAGEDYVDADFGYYQGALVEGHVFWDEDRNGLLDPEEEDAPHLLEDIQVNVVCVGDDGQFDTGDDFSASVDTDLNGYYKFITPAGYDCRVSYNTGDSDIPGTLGDATTPVTYEFTPRGGEDEHISFNFGLDNTGAIGDTVWNDVNGSGAQDAGEPGIANVTVLLYRDNNNDNQLDAGDTFLAADVTDPNGHYLFEGLADGNYVVVVNADTLPDNFAATYDNSGAADGSGQADISSGNTDLSADFGYVYSPPGGASLYTISGRVYEDANSSGNDDGETGFANVDVTVVCDYGTFVVQTDGTGAWALAGVPQGSVCTVLDADESDLPRTDYVPTETPGTPITVNGDITGLDFGYFQTPGSISGTVCEGNGDGQCQPGEPGIANVPVTLTWFGPDGILGTADDQVFNTLTDPNANYSFTNLQPGLYQIVETNLLGYTSLADADGGNPDVISPVVLPLGGSVTDQDFEDAPPPEVEITKVLAAPISGVAVVSDTITFTIRITNTGITALPTLTITDTYDANVLTLTSHSIVPDLTSPGLITWTNSLAPFLPLLPGQALTITVDFHADASTYPGVTENVVRVTGEDVLGVPIEPKTAVDDVQIIEPAIGVAKRVASNTNNGDGTYTVAYTITVQNVGDVPLSNVQVTDDLSQTFAGSGGFAVDALATSANLTASGTYTGTPPAINLLAGTDTLGVGASGLITLTVTVTPTAKLGIYENQAVASGTAPGNIVVTDLSQDGAEVDPDNDGDPTNNNDPTPVSFTEAPAIGLAKAVDLVTNNGDGTYVVTFTLTVENFGDVILTNLVITDDITTQFAGLSPTGFTATSGTLIASETWNGTAGSNILAAGQSLAVGATGTVKISFTVTPGSPQTVNNIAYARGTSPAGTNVTDQSTVGTDPDNDGGDPSNDNNNDPSDNNTPTPVAFTENPKIGVAKAVQSVDNLGGGQFRVTYLITVRNYGDVNLSNVQVTDNLATTFTGATSWSVESVTSADFTVNPGYTGSSPNTSLLVGTDSLAVGATKTITLKVLVTPGANLGPYDNTAVATGDSPSGTPVNDLSQDGTNPDPDGDNNPGNNSDLTPVTFTATTQIGVAKDVSSVINNGDGTYDITYSILVENMGDTTLSNVQVTDNLATAFPAPTTFSVVSVSSSTFSVNAGYTGVSPNTNLLMGADTLNPGVSGAIALVVRVTPGSNLGPYNNQARGTASGPGGVPTADNSQVGANPDPDGDGDPTNNNVPTPVSFTEAPAIGIAKAVASAINNGDGAFTVAYTLTVRNYGDVVLTNVQVTDDLDAAFGAGAYTVDSVTSSGFTVNPGYNGSSDINLLTATGNTLAVGETKTIVLTMTVTPATSPATYNNQATATGVSPAGAQVNDLSTVGVDPDNDGGDPGNDNDGDPTNNDEPTPVTLTQTPSIAVEKAGPAVSYVGATAVYTYTVTNTGDVRLGTVTVTDDVCGSATYVSGDTNNDGYLDVNETWLFTCSYVVQANDPDPLVNTATARGVDPLNQEKSAQDDWTTDLVQFRIGDTVWLDINGDTVPDPGEQGLYNVPVTVTGTDIDGNPVNITVYTDINGQYLVPLAKPGTYTVTTPVTFGGFQLTSPGPSGYSVTLTTAAPQYLDADFGYKPPTSVAVFNFSGVAAAVGADLRWEVFVPSGAVAPTFHLYRALPGETTWTQLTADEPVGPVTLGDNILDYIFTDTSAQPGTTYQYKLVSADNPADIYGPYTVAVPNKTKRVFLPLLLR